MAPGTMQSFTCEGRMGKSEMSYTSFKLFVNESYLFGLGEPES